VTSHGACQARSVYSTAAMLYVIRLGVYVSCTALRPTYGQHGPMHFADVSEGHRNICVAFANHNSVASFSSSDSSGSMRYVPKTETAQPSPSSSSNSSASFPSNAGQLARSISLPQYLLQSVAAIFKLVYCLSAQLSCNRCIGHSAKTTRFNMQQTTSIPVRQYPL